jgi:hypothetical protein
VVLQAAGKLLPLGEQATCERGWFWLLNASNWHWMFFALLFINATIPAMLLQAKSAFWQRIVVCYIDVFLDLMYTLVFAFYLTWVGILTGNFEVLVPTDVVSFGSNLFPLIHILSVARAIDGIQINSRKN